jgi:hypothetical protein
MFPILPLFCLFWFALAIVAILAEVCARPILTNPEPVRPSILDRIRAAWRAR